MRLRLGSTARRSERRCRVCALPLRFGLAMALVMGSVEAGRSGERLEPPYAVTNWQTEDGLPENSATAMVQTPDGYLYFGTFNGLVRFDGKRFVVFDLKNMPGLPNVGVVNLHLSPQGSLWVSTFGGLARHEGGKWRTYGPEDGWTGDYVRWSAEGRDGRVYFRTFDRKLFAYEGGLMRQLPDPPGRTAMGFLFVGEDGRLRVAGLDYISAWDGAKWESRELPKELRESRGGIHWGRSEGGRLWAVGGDWNWRVEERRIVERVRLSEPVQDIWSVTVEDGGPIWVCSYTSGLYRISTSGAVHHFTAEDGVAASSARFVYRDRQGNRWVGTSGTGLIRLKERRFVSIGSELGLPNFPVKAVASEPDGSVLLATYGAGLWRYRSGRLARETEPSGASAYVQTLLRDHRGDLWIGGPGTGLIRRGAGRDESPAPSESGGLNTVSLYEDSRGRVWMAGSTGVASFDGGEFKSYRIEGRLRGVVVRCFAEERGTGQIWAGGDAGLLKLREQGFVQVKDQGGRPLPPISAIHDAGAGTLWLGTATAELLRWREGAVRRMDPAALPSGVVGGVVEDRGTVWLATNRGVFRMPRSEMDAAFDGRTDGLTWQRFVKQDGLPSIECTVDHQPSLTRDAGGRLWLSTLKGAAMIDPGAVRVDRADVPVKVETLSFLERVGGHEREEAAGVRVVHFIPAGAMNLRIGYTAMDLSDGDRVTFRYELIQNGEAVTQGLRSERELLFPRLAHGKYALRIQARNADGVWSRKTAELRFDVAPMFWETRTFRWGALLLGAGLLIWATVVVSRRRVRGKIARLEQEMLRAGAEAQFLQAQKMESLGRLAGGVAHDFNNLLTVVNGYSDLILRELNEEGSLRKRVMEIRKAGEKGAELTRQLLLYSRQQPMELRPLELNRLIEDMLSLMRTMAGSGVKLVCRLDPGLGLIRGDAIQVSQILMNLIVNARDALPEGGIVNIETGNRTLHGGEHTGEFVVLTISDTGVGMDEATKARIFEPFFTTKAQGKGTGMGLSTVQAAMRNAQGWIEVESAVGQGSQFRAYFPRAHTSNEGE